MPRQKKPRVITNCVANHYTGPDQRIIEYSFGPDGKGGAIGGLIELAWINGTPRVTLYRHDQAIRILVGKADKTE